MVGEYITKLANLRGVKAIAMSSLLIPIHNAHGPTLKEQTHSPPFLSLPLHWKVQANLKFDNINQPLTHSGFSKYDDKLQNSDLYF